MSAIDQIVDITITQQTQAVPQAGFGIPLIVGPTGFDNSDVIRYYSSASAMLDDGFTTSDLEYKYAVKAFSQDLSPELVGIGKRTTAVKQVDTITPTAVNTTHYIVTIDAVPYDYLSDSDATVSEIVAGLIALINADANVAVVATGSTTLILTAKNFGAGFTTTVNANQALVHTTANNGIVNDLQAIINASNLWYGLAICSNQDYDILQAAAYIETLTKIFIGVSADAAIPTTATSDIATELKGLGYKRTALMYTAASEALGMEAAWLGGQLPQTPGASTWKFKQLIGIDPDTFTDTQRTILIGVPGVPGKNVNIYETVGGVNITEEGWMVGGQFIDITVGLDWLESTMQTNVFSLLVQSPKIPYTDLGAAVIQNAVLQTLKQGVSNGLIDGASPIEVTVPAVLDVPTNDRAERLLPNVTFSCRLAGAFHFIQINGTVTV